MDTGDTHSTRLPRLGGWRPGPEHRALSTSASLEWDSGWTGIWEGEDDKEAMQGPSSDAVR